MKFSYDLTGHGAMKAKFKLGATVVEGQVVIWDNTNKYGEVTDASTTGAADAFGVTLDAGTYTATPTVTTEGLATVIYSPFAVYKARANGGTTNGTALATTAPANVLTHTGTSATVVSAAEVGTASFAGGTIKALNGVNKEHNRVITSHTNSTSTTVTVAFPTTFAANSKLVRVPWSRGTAAVQLTSDFCEADAIIATGTGIPATVVDVYINVTDEDNPSAWVKFALGDHFLNKLS